MIDRRSFIGAAGLSVAGCATSAPYRQAQWRVLPTEPYRGKQDDIFFVSPDVGWYGNGAGKLFHTTNGGESWTKIWEQPGTFIRALGFLDAQRGFLGNVGTNYFPNVTDTRPLYRTADGGSTWTPVSAPGVEAVAGICSIDVLHWRRMTLIHAAGRVGGPAMIMRSMDGGESWRVIDLGAHAGMILDVKFFDAMNGFVCASSSADIEQGNALILRTRDGGETWAPAYRGAKAFENCWKMHFPSRGVGYATVQNYREGESARVVVKTVDGGETWREVELVNDPEVREFGVGFVDETWGWVGGSTTGFETRDGGETWVPIEMGRAVNKIRILHGGGHTRAFAIGAEVRRLDI